MKTLIRFCLAVVVILAGVTAFFQGSRAEVSGTFGNMTWTMDDDGILVIDGTWMDPMMSDKDAWRPYAESVKKAIIHDGMPRIGTNAFLNCINMEEIVLPDSINFIGDNAFTNCRRLTQITIPPHVTTIRSSPFTGCSSLTEITIPAGVTSFDYPTFSGCSSLANIYVEEGNELFKSISGLLYDKSGTTLLAFPGGRNNTEYTIPKRVTKIGAFAFSGNKRLKSVKIQQGVTSIELSAFSECSNLTTIWIPVTLTNVAAGAFRACNQLLSVYYGGTSAQWNAILINKQNGYNDPLTHVIVYYNNEVPSGVVTAASGYCGKNGNNLTWTLSSDGQMTIAGTGEMQDYNSNGEPWAKYSYSIRKTVIKKGVTSIGEYAFSYCYGMREISLPSTLTKIKMDAFFDCKNLTELTIPNSVTEIGHGAFAQCEKLRKIHIGKGLRTCDYPFYSCSSLTEIEVDPANTAFSSPNGILFNKNQTKLFYYPVGRTNTTYTVPDTVTDVEEAFRGSKNLTSITLPQSLTTIGSGAMIQCDHLISVTIPSSVTMIDYSAFHEATSLKHVYYSGSEEAWSQIEIRYGNNPLDKAEKHFHSPAPKHILTLPAGLKTIESHALAGLALADAVRIPPSVTSIADDALEGSEVLILGENQSFALKWAADHGIPYRVE